MQHPRVKREAPQKVKDARARELQRRYSSARALTLREYKVRHPEEYQYIYEDCLRQVHRKRGPLPGD